MSGKTVFRSGFFFMEQKRIWKQEISSLQESRVFLTCIPDVSLPASTLVLKNEPSKIQKYR